MQTDYRCIPCFFNQCIRAGKLAGADPLWIKSALQEVSAYLADAPLEKNPSFVGSEVHRIMRRALGNPDPFREAKRRNTKEALAMLPSLRERVLKAKDPLLEALRVAVAGNVIDFAGENDPHPEKQISEALKKPFPLDDYRSFVDELKKISNLLVLADNAGEIVFDRILIEILREKGLGIVVAVKESPVVNDATFEDAYSAGVHKEAGIISTGCDSVGTDLSKSSPQFVRRFKSAELILAKGQGHYETLHGIKAPIWHLFVVKCEMVAEERGAKVGSIMFFRGSPR